MPNISCSVQECQYNNSNICEANSVHVSGSSNVTSSSQTECDTFINDSHSHSSSGSSSGSSSSSSNNSSNSSWSSSDNVLGS